MLKSEKKIIEGIYMNEQSFNMKVLKTLCDAFGPSSCEDDILDIIQQILGQSFFHYVTPHKNLVVFNPSDKNKSGRTIVFQSHMDELGIKPRRYLDNGLIEVLPISVISDDFNNQKIIFNPGNISGILTVRKEDKNRTYYVDIGVSNKEDAERLVPVYSAGSAKNSVEVRESKIFGKAFDARAAIAAIVSAMHSSHLLEKTSNKTVAVFSAREETTFWPHREIGSAFREHKLKPDLFINIEICPGTLAPFVMPTGAEIGKGVVIAHMDNSYVSNPQISKRIIEIAEKNSIKYQDMISRAGNGELGKLCYELESDGIGLALPAFAMHSPNSIISKDDYFSLIELIKAIISEY